MKVVLFLFLRMYHQSINIKIERKSDYDKKKQALLFEINKFINYCRYKNSPPLQVLKSISHSP